jgi:hypothetical protein
MLYIYIYEGLNHFIVGNVWDQIYIYIYGIIKKNLVILTSQHYLLHTLFNQHMSSS